MPDPNTWTGPVIEDNKFKYTYTADQAQVSGYTLKLATENKFVDKDIWAKVIITQGSLGKGAGNVSLSNHGATGLLGTVTTTQPDGHYLEIVGQGTISVSSGGWIAKDVSEISNEETKYYPIQSAAFGWGTGTNANKLYCTTSGYIAASNSTEIESINTTSVVQTNITTINGTTATGATATWGTGYITSGSISAATFDNEPASGKTANSYVDISNTTAAPVLISKDYLYINRGYVDDIRIKLSKLIPDSAVKPNGASSYSQGLLSGYALYDEDGNLVTGSINTITLPSSTSASATTDYTEQATIYASTSDQYINIPAGFNAVNSYYKINKLSSSSYTAANIKHNVTISVSNGDGNVFSVKGTFTKASTATATNGAVTYNSSNISSQILSGYSAWVDGKEITGNIPTKTSSNLSFNTSTGVFTAPAGYYASNATKTIGIAAVTPAIANPTTVLNTYFEKLTNSTGASVTITPQYTNTVGYIEAHSTAQSGTALYYKIRTATFNDMSNSGNVALNYDADTNNLSIYRSSSSTGGVSISASAPAANSGKVYIKVTGSGTVTAATAGWITEGGTTATGSKVMYISLNKYDGSFTTG